SWRCGSSPTTPAGSPRGRCRRSGCRGLALARRVRPDALLALRLEERPLLAPELGRGLVAEPPLAPDPVPVARRVELPEDGEHAGLHPPPHELVRGHVLAPHEVVEARARVRH